MATMGSKGGAGGHQSARPVLLLSEYSRHRASRNSKLVPASSFISFSFWFFSCASFSSGTSAPDRSTDSNPSCSPAISLAAVNQRRLEDFGMSLEGALSLSTSAGRPDRLCSWSPQGGRRLLDMNHVRMSRGWKARDMLGAVRCESYSPEQGDDEPISALRPDQGTTSSFRKNSFALGVDDIARTAANAPAREDRKNGLGAVMSTDVLQYGCAQSRAYIALRPLDAYLRLASSICDEVDTAFRAPNSRKPLRLSTTSWELLE